MKYFVIITSITLFMLASCKKNNYQKVKADLTFRSISFSSAYGATNKEYNNLVKDIDSVLNNDKIKEVETVKLYNYFSKLKEYDLLKSPYIFLNFEKDSIMTVYLSEREYEKINGIKHVDLYKENKKVVLELEIKKMDENIYYSNNIIKIHKVEGTSRSNIQ